jgi:hypothetical protein
MGYWRSTKRNFEVFKNLRLDKHDNTLTQYKKKFGKTTTKKCGLLPK